MPRQMTWARLCISARASRKQLARNWPALLALVVCTGFSRHAVAPVAIGLGRKFPTDLVSQMSRADRVAGNSAAMGCVGVFLAAIFFGSPSKTASCEEHKCLLEPPELQERHMTEVDRKTGKRFTIVLCGLTGAGKSAVANLLSGSNCFKEGNDFASVTAETSKVDFEFGGQKFRIIDTPGFFDTTVTNDQISKSISNFSKFSNDGIDAVLIVTRKGRFTKENQEVSKFMECVLGKDALKKYGFLIVSHTIESQQNLKDGLEQLSTHNKGRQMLNIVSNRVLPVQTKSWWHRRSQRRTILEELVKQAHANNFSAIDCEMLKWERIREQERKEFENKIAPLRAKLESDCQKVRDEAQREIAALRAELETSVGHQRVLQEQIQWTQHVKAFGQGVKYMGEGLAYTAVAAAAVATVCSIQ